MGLRVEESVGEGLQQLVGATARNQGSVGMSRRQQGSVYLHAHLQSKAGHKDEVTDGDDIIQGGVGLQGGAGQGQHDAGQQNQ